MLAVFEDVAVLLESGPAARVGRCEMVLTDVSSAESSGSSFCCFASFSEACADVDDLAISLAEDGLIDAGAPDGFAPIAVAAGFDEDALVDCLLAVVADFCDGAVVAFEGCAMVIVAFAVADDDFAGSAGAVDDFVGCAVADDDFDGCAVAVAGAACSSSNRSTMPLILVRSA